MLVRLHTDVLLYFLVVCVCVYCYNQRRLVPRVPCDVLITDAMCYVYLNDDGDGWWVLMMMVLLCVVVVVPVDYNI